jgi:CheY-like chemotaxis protein
MAGAEPAGGGENDAELRSLTAALFEGEQMDSIECESAEAAPAVLLIGGREVAMIFADVRLRGLKDGIDLAREVKMRWPRLPMILTSGYPRERVGHLPKLGFISRIGAVALWPNALVEVGVSLPELAPLNLPRATKCLPYNTMCGTMSRPAVR